MRVWIVVALLWPSVATAEPTDRSIEVISVAGASGFSPTSRWSLNHYDPRPYTDDTMPTSYMVGLAIAWERDPASFPPGRVTVVDGKRYEEPSSTIAPELDLVAHGHRMMAVGGIRLEGVLGSSTLVKKSRPIRMWITPHAGVITGPTSAVIGFDYITQFQIGRRWGLAMVMGLNFWRQPWSIGDATGDAIERTTMPAPRTLWTGQFFGGFAFTLRL